VDLRIPKRIIQTGKSLDLPLLSRASVANLRLLNPDYEYLFFDNAQVEMFIDEKFPEYRNVFESFRFPIQRYDFFRYLAVYQFGGLYFDLDVFLASSLDGLLGFNCVFPFEELTMNTSLARDYGMDWEIGNYAFGAAAGHPFISAIIENCVRAQKDPEWAETVMRSIPRIFRDEYHVLYTTGPGLVSRTLAEFPDAASQVKVLFPEDVRDSTCWHRFGEFGVHFQDGSWRSRKGFVLRRLHLLWEAQTRKKLLQESLGRGKSRSLEFKTKTVRSHPR
jgi:mannosyltransferase OCH1-like enzyme